MNFDKIRHIPLIAIAICLLLTATRAEAAARLKNETLHYVISYKWGLIHKDAGEATLSLRNSGPNYKVTLTAKTKPWADKIYMVRDTLLGQIRANGLVPLSYQKITNENGKYDRDEIHYGHSGGTTTGTVKRYKLRDGQWKIRNKTLTATGPVYDMLSVFYYLRQLDYSQLNKNKIYTATVFSGSKKEKISIRSLGKTKIKLKNGSVREAYHIKFKFTQDGGKKSSDDMDSWISTDAAHIPLYLVGKLPVGEVRCYFVG